MSDPIPIASDDRREALDDRVLIQVIELLGMTFSPGEIIEAWHRRIGILRQEMAIEAARQ